MAYELKPGQGSLWPNDNKYSDKSPDFRGDYKDHDGSMHKLEAWWNKTQGGKEWLNIRKTSMEAYKAKVAAEKGNRADTGPRNPLGLAKAAGLEDDPKPAQAPQRADDVPF